MRGKQPTWLDDLKRLVSMRTARETVSPHLVLSLLQAVIDDFDCATSDHGGSWNFEVWRSGFSSYPAGKHRLDLLAASLPSWQGKTSGWRLIARGDVFQCDEPLLLFLAAMAWGFGPSGYGWRRTLDILTAAGDNAVVKAMRTLQRSHTDGGPGAVWEAFSAGGTAKVNGLGTAFASKIAYFTCYDRQQGNGPLIADRNTAWAFWVLDDVWDSRASATLYARYVVTATGWATRLRSLPDDVERALFVLGPHVRAIYGELRPPRRRGTGTVCAR